MKALVITEVVRQECEEVYRWQIILIEREKK